MSNGLGGHGWDVVLTQFLLFGLAWSGQAHLVWDYSKLVVSVCVNFQLS